MTISKQLAQDLIIVHSNVSTDCRTLAAAQYQTSLSSYTMVDRILTLFHISDLLTKNQQ